VWTAIIHIFNKQIGVNVNTEELRRKARQLYNNKLVSEDINQHNQRKWVRSVLRLGDKYLLAKKVERIQ
jgi:predicted ATP-grasp superfamily ATP-dependent carboligase